MTGNPGKWVLTWKYSVRAFQWKPTWQGLDDFQDIFIFCALDKSCLSIERVNLFIPMAPKKGLTILVRIFWRKFLFDKIKSKVCLSWLNLHLSFKYLLAIHASLSDFFPENYHQVLRLTCWTYNFWNIDFSSAIFPYQVVRLYRCDKTHTCINPFMSRILQDKCRLDPQHFW